MINSIISYINKTLSQVSFIEKVYDIVEIVQNDETPARRFPGKYIGKDQLIRVEFEPDMIYHRIVGNMPLEYLDEDFSGNDKRIGLKFPIKLVGCVGRSELSDTEIIQKIIYELSNITFKKLKGDIKFQSINIRILSSNMDRYQIWNEETDGSGLSVDFEKALISINYQIEIITTTQCLNNCDALIKIWDIIPVALPASNITTTSFTANWEEVDNIVGYIFDAAKDDQFTIPLVLGRVSYYGKNIIGNILSIDISPLPPGSIIYYRFYGYNNNSHGKYSNTIKVII